MSEPSSESADSVAAMNRSSQPTSPPPPADPDAALRAYIDYGVRHGWWRKGTAHVYDCRRLLFPRVDFRGKTFLDVGCGEGRYVLWAAVCGASLSMGMEPGEHGAKSHNILDELVEAAAELKTGNVQTSSKTLQEFDPEDRLYDIVLLRHSINHLDEEACITLHESQSSRDIYLEMFRKLRSMMVPGGLLIATDVGRRNIYADLGMKHPKAKSIEWHKHQQPSLWAKLLLQGGFDRPRTSWISPGRYFQLGWPLRNALVAYLTRSYFRVEVRAA